MLRDTAGGGRKGYIRYKQIDTMAFSIPPSLRDTSPIANATQRRSLIVDFPLTASSISCGITRYLHPPPLCFAAQNIGEVSAGRRG